MVGVLTERTTLKHALAGRSIARFGDGELNIIYGERAAQQRFDAKLQKELLTILVTSPCLVCVPHTRGPRREYWQTYLDRHVIPAGRRYGSAFISRPDEAPDSRFMNTIHKLWDDKDTVLVRSMNSLDKSHIPHAREVLGPVFDAYDEIDRLEAEIGRPEVAILCMGATATCLADRLCRKGVHAIDLGNIGRFMRPVR